MATGLRPFGILLFLSFLVGCSTVDRMVDQASGWVGKDQSIAKLAPLAIEEVKPSIVWSERIGDGTAGLIVRVEHQVVGDMLYMASVDGEIAAIDLPSGAVRWNVNSKERIMSGVVVGPRNLYVGNESGYLVAFDRETGQERWSLSLLSELLSPVAIAPGRVIVRTVDGKISAVNSENGEKLWNYEREVPVLTLRGTGTPIVVEDQVIAGLDSGEVVALALEDGREHWLKSVTTARGRTEIERMVDIDADPVVAGDKIYVVGYQGNLAALNVADGEQLWKRKVSAVQQPMTFGGYLFLSDQEGNVWAFDQKDGTALWKQDQLKERSPTTPLLVGKSLIVGDSEGYLHWISAEDGHLQGRLKFDQEGITVSPRQHQGSLVVVGNSGKVALISH
ncbi:MAG: outer membrane protein assembly factor BamB [Gammaproteobacteria bacterium]|jgi:outer membrane protein assembly factor BamB|nr:outer membrane protein assembly factor BamB [Gammaproteobacteria bacterium]MBT3488875.1 outer membrane protein assembly factor BamB [Gammaproteobacteria bacterium]MBT3719315.1 outer membrane protein assembly factor BamB [Gammaproteobacteria bacterium]MBT3844493.1 outer membrane protein assembly factor BamB [Gammaproteobacteria bacterium]MBT3891947.1 outer membrane protein assembly factor BamB [Gammaproteobacteria bacterium]